MTKVKWNKLTTSKPAAFTTQGEYWAVIDDTPVQREVSERGTLVSYTYWRITLTGKLPINTLDQLEDKATGKVYLVDEVSQPRGRTVCLARSTNRNG